MTTVLNQIFQSIDKASTQFNNVRIYVPSEGPVQIRDANAEADLSFNDNVVIPIVSGSSTSPTTDLIPKISATTKGFRVRVSVVANPKDHPNGIVATVVFLQASTNPLEVNLKTTKDTNTAVNLVPTPLQIDAKAPKILWGSFRFRSVQVVLNGLSDPKGELKILGTCAADQRLLNLDTNKVTYVPSSDCGFEGSYDRTTSKGGILLHYMAKSI